MPTLYDSTNISSIGLGFILVMTSLVFLLPKRFAVLPLIITAIYVTLGQQLLIAVFNFSAMRLIILFTWMRLILKGEIPEFKFNSIDKAIIWWVLANFIAYNLLWQSSEAFVNRLGFAFNALGLYFLFRFAVHDLSDVERIFKMLSIVIIPLAAAMIYEYSTGRNIFSAFGGVPEITVQRGEHFRSQGAFRHAILAGTFGATLAPVLLAMWFRGGRYKGFAVVGAISATVIMVTSASSGALMAYIFGIIGLLAWSFHRQMKMIRWGLLYALISLHIVMEAPVWYLIAHFGRLFGGGGWHRSYLIDQAIAHFGQWWLIGMTYTADWMPYSLASDPTKADITNYYIAQGVDGGLLTLILFLMVILRSFQTIGSYLKVKEESPFAEKIIVWALGAALFSHVVSFLSVTYFDQIIVFWYLLLAMISSVGASTVMLKPKIEKAPFPFWQSE